MLYIIISDSKNLKRLSCKDQSNFRIITLKHHILKDIRKEGAEYSFRE